MKQDYYLQAAKLIDKGTENYSCIAISVASRADFYNRDWLKERYVKTFARDEDTLQELFDDSLNDRDLRVLALLFMHWISQEDEK